MADPRRFAPDEMLITAARAVGKIDAMGDRGCTGVSIDEIAAMAAVLVLLGLRPIPLGVTETTMPLILQPTLKPEVYHV